MMPDIHIYKQGFLESLEIKEKEESEYTTSMLLLATDRDKNTMHASNPQRSDRTVRM